MDRLNQNGSQYEEEKNENDLCYNNFPFIRGNFNIIQRPKLFMIDCVVIGMLEKINRYENSKKSLLTYASLIYNTNSLSIESFDTLKDQLIAGINEDNIERHFIYLFLILFATYFNVIIFLCKNNSDEIAVVYPLFNIASEIGIGYNVGEIEGLVFEFELLDSNKCKLSYLLPIPNVSISKYNINKTFVDLVSNEKMSIFKY